MNVLYYGDYVLIKPQGFRKSISKIFKPDSDSVIDKEHPMYEYEVAIIEKVEDEKLFVRIFGQLKLIQINPDEDIIKTVEPSDYDIISKSLQPVETKRISLTKRLGALASLLTILNFILPLEIKSQELIIPNNLIILIVIWSLFIAFVLGVQFSEKDKRHMKDLLVFEQKYKPNSKVVQLGNKGDIE
ncbi:Uncharacterised protein [uncultured archaeon]|nr:Uncharacterised protein [uncultured archaeon]